MFYVLYTESMSIIYYHTLGLAFRPINIFLFYN